MKPLITILLTALLLAFTLPFGQAIADENGCDHDGVKVTASFRARMESDNRDFNADTGPGSFGLLRARVNMFWKQGDFKGYVQLHQPVTAGATGGADPASPTVHRAMFGREHCMIGDGYIWVGRMTLTFADERLIGANDWGQVGNAFDGMLWGRKSDDYWVELFYTKLVENYVDAATPVRDNAFGGLWFEWTPLNLQAFYLNRSRSAARPAPAVNNWQFNDVRHTLGIHYDNKYDNGFGTNFNFAYQMGTMTTLAATEAGDTDADIAAWLLTLAAWYQVDSPLQPKFGAGIDWATGDDPTTPEAEAFSDLYPTRHSIRGYMDYFPTNPNYGLRDIFAMVKTRGLGEKSWVKLVFHNFSGSEDYAADKTAIGNEIDIVLGKKKGMMDMEAGLGYFMASEDWIGPDKDAGMWAYMQLSMFLSGNDEDEEDDD